MNLRRSDMAFWHAAAGEEGVTVAGLAPFPLGFRDGCARPTALPRLRPLEPLEFEPDMRICCHIYLSLNMVFNSTETARRRAMAWVTVTTMPCGAVLQRCAAGGWAVRAGKGDF